MKTKLSVLFALAPMAAQDHESLAPPHHPHGVSALPGLGAVALGAVVLAAALMVYLNYRRG